MGMIGAHPGRIRRIQSTFASPNSAFPCGYRRLRSVRREELRPELLDAPCAPAGIALSLRYQPGTTTSTILFQLDVHARSRCLACGEIAKGIDDDAQSTRVRSIGRGDGSLAGMERIGSSVNHRLA